MSAIPVPTDPAPSSFTTSIPASRVGIWLRDGLRLWKRCFFMLIALSICSLLIESLLQMIPWAGVVISKIVVPMCDAGIWVGLDATQRGGRLRFSSLWAGWRQSRWIGLWMLSAATGLFAFGFQTGCAWLAYRHGVIDAVVFGHPAAHRELMTRGFECALILPGIVSAVSLLFAIPLFIFRDATAATALGASIRIVLASPVPFVLLMLLQTALFALCFIGGPMIALLLLLLPWGTALGYAVWNDVSHECLSPEPHADTGV